MSSVFARSSAFVRRWTKLFLPVLILAFLVWQGHQFLKEIKPGEALRLMRHIPLRDHLILISAALLAVLAMSLYDVLLLRWNRTRLPARSVLKVSWVANSFNNAMGFAGFTGIALRLALYRRKGVDSPTLFKSALMMSTSMMTGLSLLGWPLLAGFWPDGGMLANRPWLTVVVAAVSAYPLLLIALPRVPLLRRLLRLDDELARAPRLAAFGVSLLEWTGAAFVFWLSARMLHLPLGFRETTGIYVMSAVAGVASFMPGGLGSFDILSLIGLQAFGIAPDKAFAVIIVFRIMYYFIPWLIGLALASSEWMPGRDNREMPSWTKPVVKSWVSLWNWPAQSAILRDIGNWALAALVFTSGMLLLLSAFTPEHWHRILLLNRYVTPVTMKFSHQLTVIIGLIMLVISDGIRMQLRRAYQATLVLLLAGAAFSILKGFDFEEAIFLIAVFVLVWLSKGRFRRENVAFGAKRLVTWVVVTLLITVMYLSIGHWTAGMPHRLHRGIPFYGHYPLKEQVLVRHAIVALFTTWIALTARALLRPRIPPSPRPTSRELASLQHFLETHDGNFLTHLYFLGDKTLLSTPDGHARLAFGRVWKTLIALGDPIGEPRAVAAIVQQFREHADRYAAAAVFYQIKPEQMPLYHEHGYRFFKLGEEAVVRLDTFGLSGKSKADLRAANNRFDREGFRFEMVSPPFSPLFLVELKELSDDWLQGRKEKGFSLGCFQETYLELAPVAVVRDGNGRLCAFASMMPSYDGGRSISVDLMRFRKGVLNGLMDALFVRLLEWARSEGYERFNLGMSPLASVGKSSFSHREERIAHWIYRRGNHFYGFEGIRRFKEKFGPVWEPRYLAYPKNVSLSKLVVQLTWLISRDHSRHPSGNRKASESPSLPAE